MTTELLQEACKEGFYRKRKMAHLRDYAKSTPTRIVALCGTVIRGVPAYGDHDTCIVCREMEEARRRHRR